MDWRAEKEGRRTRSQLRRRPHRDGRAKCCGGARPQHFRVGWSLCFLGLDTRVESCYEPSTFPSSFPFHYSNYTCSQTETFFSDIKLGIFCPICSTIFPSFCSALCIFLFALNLSVHHFNNSSFSHSFPT